MQFNQLKDLDIKDKKVLIRVDMNVPIKAGNITDDTRIRASLASIEYCLKKGASVILMTHLGRPIEGMPKPEDTVQPVTRYLSECIGHKVHLLKNWQQTMPHLKAGEVVMLENVRLNVGERENDSDLGYAYASLCDVFVNDAFGTAHRAEASTYAVAKFAPIACAGLLLTRELEALSLALENPKRPLVAIVAGSKVSSKLCILESLADKVDQLIVGGGIANTFLLAKSYPIGKSLAEHDLTAEANNIMQKIATKGGNVPLPTDVVTAEKFSESAKECLKNIHAVTPNDMILDIGPKSAKVLADIVANAGTIVWNGPVGVFEFAQFASGTRTLARAIGASSAFSIAGGGDTLAAISQFGVTAQIDYISTGGGAFLEFLEGKELPAVHILKLRANR